MKLSEISIKNIPGIGDKKYSVLAEELNIRSVEDLFFFRPRRYIDRSSLLKISEIRQSLNEISVIGEVVNITAIRAPKQILKVDISDGTGILTAVFFGGIKFFSKLFESGDTVIFSGKADFNYKNAQMVHPEFDFISEKNEAVNTARIVPVYPLTEKLRQNYINTRFLRKTIKFAADNYLSNTVSSVPETLISKHRLISYSEALLFTHFPENMEQVENSRKRLAFDELFFYMFYLSIAKIISRKTGKKAIQFSNQKLNEIVKSLPFELTAGQSAAVEEIIRDLSSENQMNRLLQGDVGSGKTAVAVLSIAAHVLSGSQAAFMAPTEVLARQHYVFCKNLLSGWVKVDYISGASTQSERSEIYSNLEKGSTDLIIGTHALFQENVRFKNLRYIVIDEQHRFGVEQRLKLHQKGTSPDLLVMTATPIPRSLTLTVFGDLDVSIIRDKPAGRASVKTLVYPESRLRGVYNSINKYLSEGRQCYYVLPLIEESEKSDLKSAKEVFSHLSSLFSSYRVEILHGKMTSEQKLSIMNDFKENRISILVSTTVIEVGVDVPNSNIIVIHHAERFGLAQLHQLRGRVGRGMHDSFCVLVYSEGLTEDSVERLRYLENCADGFLISEYDLKARGSGQLTGMMQHGFRSEFTFLNPVDDTEMILHAREDIDRIIGEMKINSDIPGLKALLEEKNVLKISGAKIFSMFS